MKNLVYLKAITLWAILLFVSLSSFAQPGRGQGRGRQFTQEDVKQRVSNMADSLDMTAEQEQKILDIELEYWNKNQEMRENFDPSTGDRQAIREYMMNQREERNAKYAEILSEEQMGKYQEMVDRRRQNMRQRLQDDSGGRGRGRGRG